MAESKGTLTLFPGQSSSSPILYLVSFPEEGEEVHRLLRERTQADFTFVLCTVPDWNRDLSPWPAPALGKGEAFAGGAAAYLRWLLEEVVSSPSGPSFRRITFNGPPRCPALSGIPVFWTMCRTQPVPVFPSGCTSL